MYDVVLLRPPGVQAHTVSALAKLFIMGLLPRFWEMPQLVTAVVISPNTLRHLSVLRPMRPSLTCVDFHHITTFNQRSRKKIQGPLVRLLVKSFLKKKNFVVMGIVGIAISEDFLTIGEKKLPQRTCLIPI